MTGVEENDRVLPELLPHARYSGDLAKALISRATEVENLRGMTNFEDKYVAWVDEAGRLLKNDLTPSQVENALRTSGYWAVVAGARPVKRLVLVEIDEVSARLRSMAEAVQHEAAAWNQVRISVVPDTNCLLHEIDSVVGAPWHAMADLLPGAMFTLAIPLKVVDEMDRQKRNKSAPTKVAARHRIRELAGLLGGGEPINLPGTGDRVRLTWIANPVNHVPLDDADSEIVDRAASLHQRLEGGGQVLLLTADVGMMLRARTAGLDVRFQTREDKSVEAQERAEEDAANAKAEARARKEG